MDTAFLNADTFDALPSPSQIGACRVGGIDMNKARIRAVIAAVCALSACPNGFSASDLATKVAGMRDSDCKDYGSRQAAYDLKKLRGKSLVEKVGKSRRYEAPPDGLRAMTALVVLRDRVIRPILAGAGGPRQGRPPANISAADRHYETLRKDMNALFASLGIAA